MRWKTITGKILIAVVLTVFVGALWAIVSVSRDRPVEHDDITEHFKYGSIGSEPGGSLLRPVGGTLPPYWMFRALPSICRDKLPGGYASLGLVTEPGKDLPIGISRRRRLGVDQVGFNCAICHTGTVRDAPGAPPRIVLGMPSHQLDLQALVNFVLECSLDNRMTRDNLLGRAREMGGVGPSLFERLLLRLGLVDRLKIQVLDLRNRIEPVLSDRLPRWGRGRVDTFNPYKSIQFNWPLDRLPPSELIGAADFPSLWNQAPREGMHLHWDGDNDSVDERNLSAALGAGIADIGTDRHRLDSYTDEFAANQYALYPDSPYRFSHFRKTGGYANHPLDGIWLRGPFLHNGSVPTLRDLLDAPDARPKVFYRGYDLFDLKKVGFVSDVPHADGHDFSRFDTSLPGNGNGGHVYGTTLSDGDKAALVEHLKTF
jgi:hypothetical protein